MIAAAVIASGYSRRMGRSKLTLPLQGRTFLERAVDAVVGARLVGCRFVVVRPEDATLIDSLNSPSIEVVLNPDAAEGQSASIRHVVHRVLQEPECEALVLSVVDQPFLDSNVFDLLAERWRTSDTQILVSSYAGQRGNPVLFARPLFHELAVLAGDVGGRVVIQAHPETVSLVDMPNPHAGRDVDTWEEYEALTRQS